MKRIFFRGVALTAALLIVSTLGTHMYMNACADALFDDDEATLLGLAEEVAVDALAMPSVDDFATGSARFDGEWALGTCQMAVVGMSRVLAIHPEHSDRLLPGIRACSEQLLSRETHRFGTTAWGTAALDQPGDFHGHAYMGYVATALGSHRRVDPDFPHVALHDALVDSFVAQLEEMPIYALQTYPGERYPPDQSVVLAAIALHPDDHRALLETAITDFHTAVDPETGLFFQAVGRSGAEHDRPRGSGTTFGALWLAEVDDSFSAELWTASKAQLFDTWFGVFGTLYEYPGDHEGPGDIDSGPLILGTSISSTGFALASAKVHGDRAAFRALYRTSHLFGVPTRTRRGWRYQTGGSLGNAILLGAMTTPLNRTDRASPPCSGSTEPQWPDCG